MLLLLSVGTAFPELVRNEDSEALLAENEDINEEKSLGGVGPGKKEAAPSVIQAVTANRLVVASFMAAVAGEGDDCDVPGSIVCHNESR